MREAGVDLVTLGGVLVGLAAATSRTRGSSAGSTSRWTTCTRPGSSVDLATATASPPPWLTHRHPEMLPVTQDGRTLWPGGRQAFCPSSPVYREHALALCTRDGRALPRPPGAGAVARVQRARLPQRPLLLRRQRGGVPHVAAPPVRRRRGAAQRRVGHGVLVPALRRLRARCCRHAWRPTSRQPDPAARLPRASPPTSCSTTSSSSATCCTGSHPACR